MIATVFVVYIYINKFTSVIYFSKSLNPENTIESLARSEKMLVNAITLDKNDLYYRALSQVYINQVGVLLNDKTISQDTLKTSLQKLINLAQSSANSAVFQNPKQYLNHKNLGDIYSALVPLAVDKSYESAVVAYDKARELAPNNPAILLSRAQLELANKNNSEAKKYINQALEIKPNYTDAMFFLAQIKVSEGDSAGAIKQAEQAGEMDPNDPTIFFRLGLLRYDNSDYTGAVSAFEQAVILDPNYLNARYYLGQSYQKVGRKDDAFTQYKILNKVIPDNQVIKDAMGTLSLPEVINPEPAGNTTDNKEPAKTPNKKNKLP